MAWKDIVGFVKSVFAEGKDLFSKIGGKFDNSQFHDYAGISKGKNGFVMFENSAQAARNEVDLLSLGLYNDKYNITSQVDLERAYSNMYDEQFVRRVYDQQIQMAERGEGFLAERYSNFDFSGRGANLTQEQRSVLLNDFMQDYDSRLNDIYEAYVPQDIVLSEGAIKNRKGQSLRDQAWIERFSGDVVDGNDIVEAARGTMPTDIVPTSTDLATNTTMPVPTGGAGLPDVPLNGYERQAIGGPTTPLLGGGSGQSIPLLGGPTGSNVVDEAIDIHPRARDLNFNYGMQKKYINNNVNVYDFATSADSVDMRSTNARINSSTHADELRAYRTYLNDNLSTTPNKNGSWNAPESIHDYFTGRGYAADVADELEREYNSIISKNIASGDPDHSGLGLWKFAKKHPVIATATVLGTVHAVADATEEDGL